MSFPVVVFVLAQTRVSTQVLPATTTVGKVAVAVARVVVLEEEDEVKLET